MGTKASRHATIISLLLSEQLSTPNKAQGYYDTYCENKSILMGHIIELCLLFDDYGAAKNSNNRTSGDSP